MSLTDLGKNDISEETQALKDKLASRDTECAGIRSQLMKREAELEELRVTLNETVYKLSREAQKALQLEEQVSTQSSELRTERISLRNAELALQSTQDKLKAEERAKRELESTLDTLSLHSQTTSAENQSVQREKHALESRVRELERMVQTHEARRVSNVPHKAGRPRSSSVSTFRLPAMEQELNDIKAQLHAKDTSLRMLEQKLVQVQDDLVKAENARISIDKTSQKRMSELISTLERKEEELESLRETENTGEREEELLKRIDEDAAKISALEKLVAETQATRTSQARIQKLQGQLKAECEKVQRSEDIQNRLLREKEDMVSQYETSQCKIREDHELLLSRECQIKELEAKYAHLLAEVNGPDHHIGSAFHQPGRSPSQRQEQTFFPNESALADHIQTLLRAIDRLRDERNGLKRALEFSEVEYHITTEGFQARIASLTKQLTKYTDANAADRPIDIHARCGMKRLTSCATALGVVISHLQTQLDLSEDRLSMVTADLTSSNSQLSDALTVINSHTNTYEYDDLVNKLDATAKELSESYLERDQLRLQLADMDEQAVNLTERTKVSEAAREEALQNFLLTEQRFTTLNEKCHDIESERNSLALQITNLQGDLAHVRDELVDVQGRYHTLYAQQLSATSASEIVQALKDHIQELEACVTHHTEQTCAYQHDICRLETHLKLYEERIAEMASELELFASQKAAMVEDCTEARRARDEAIGRLEAVEEESEGLQRQVQQAKQDHERTTAYLADLQVKNAEITCKLESLDRDHLRLTEQMNTAISRSQSLELEASLSNAEMQQAVVSFAAVYRANMDSTRRLQRSHEQIAILELQLDTFTQSAKEKDALIDSMGDDKCELLQQLSALREEVDNVQADCDIDMHNVLQEREQELATVRQMLEETKDRYSETETELLERIAAISKDLQGKTEQIQDCANLREELENIKTQLRDSRENFTDLEKVYSDVVQELITAREIFEHRLAENDEQIRSLDADHQQSLSVMEDLRQTITDMSHRLAEAEEEVHAKQGERQSLQLEMTNLQAEIQQSMSLTRYLESQVRESEDACMLLKEELQRSELSLAQAEKATKSAEFNFTLQMTQHEKVVTALRREIASLQPAPELHSALAELEEKNRVMDDLLMAKCQEIEEYDDRILDTLKANKKLTSKVDSLTRKVLALQTKLSSMKSQPQDTMGEIISQRNPSSIPSPPIPPPTMTHVEVHHRENSAPAQSLRSKTPEPQPQLMIALPPYTPGRTRELSECEISAGKKRPAPDDDERDSVPAEGHYSIDASLRNGPTPRLRRAHGHPAGFTPVRGASTRKPGGLSSPGRRMNVGITPSDIITDVTNSPRGISRQGDAQLKKKGWLGKIRGGAGSQPASSRLGTLGGQ